MPGCRILSRFHIHTHTHHTQTHTHHMHTHTHTHHTHKHTLVCARVRVTEIMERCRTGRRNMFCNFRMEYDGCVTGREQTIRINKHCQEVCETASVHWEVAQFGELVGRYNNHYVGMEEWSLSWLFSFGTRRKWVFLAYICETIGDRGGTVVKVLCYKSEGRWFDPSWCHWNFSLT